MSRDRTAIVTGAGKRIGAAIARALLEDGWNVVAHVRRDEDAVPEGAVKVVADLARADCAELLFAAAAGVATPSLLVNNAARFAHDSIAAFDVEEFDLHMAVNARAPLLLTAAFAELPHQGADALVVNLLDSKLASPNPDFLSYTVSKQALAGITELCARALAGKAIRVNAIAPALVLRSAGQSEDNFKAMHVHNPLGRGVEAADVIAALRFLIGSPAITGEVLTIDGGQRFMALERDVQFLDGR